MSPPQQIGHYTIVAKLGAGGMGAVYRASDTKLHRDVAIKVLPEAFANDADRLARFTREAQVLAALNHPNIAAIYGVETCALVMELVDGPTLAERIAEGPMPLDEALPVARQIAEALEYAHERGIIHRDLKPANIKLTPEGRVKVLDFGLAKALTSDIASADAANSPTLTMRQTAAGVILGTAAYMSPEQARGKSVDKRADIWAFGVILYELVTGKPLFPGETVTEVLAQVIAGEPDYSAAPAALHPLLRRCLERDPKKRLHDIADIWFLLDSAPRRPDPVASRVPWLLAALLLLTTLLFVFLWLRTPRTLAPPLQFGLDFSQENWLSPDGYYILRVRDSLELRTRDQVDWRVLPATLGAQRPFWSEDSTGIGFFVDGRLKLVPLDGKTPIRDVAPAPEPAGGSWRGGLAGGKIVFASAGRIQSVDLSTGAVRELPIPVQPKELLLQPVFLPEGDGFVFLLQRPRARTLMRSHLSSPGAPPERMIDTMFRAAFARNPRTHAWHIFYSSVGRTVVTAPVDPRSGVPKGPPVKVLDNLSTGGAAFLDFSVANNGMIAWLTAPHSLPIWRLRWFDRGGAVLGTVGDPGYYISLALSPDESRVVVRQGYPLEEFWVYSVDRGTGARLATGFESNAVWSADSRSVYYPDRSSNGLTVVRHPVDGSGPEPLVHTPLAFISLALEDITPDGKTLIFWGSGADGHAGLFGMDVPSPQTEPVFQNLLPNFAAARIGRFARVAPGGHALIFSAGDVPNGLYAVPYPPHGAAPKLISTNSSDWPFFSRDGRFLYGFSSSEPPGLTVQPVLPGGDALGLRLGERGFLFPLRSPTRVGGNIGATTRDGSRILTISGDESEQLKGQILTDWTTLLPGH